MLEMVISELKNITTLISEEIDPEPDGCTTSGYNIAYDNGYWDGMYSFMSLSANGVTVILWVSWVSYVCLRTIAYECTKIPSKKTWKDQELDTIAEMVDWDKMRSGCRGFCRFFCCRLDDVFDESDHTCTRNRSIRFFCCLHAVSGIFAFILFWSFWYEDIRKDWVCVFQGVLVQFLGFQIFWYVSIIFTWYIVGEFMENKERIVIFCVNLLSKEIRIKRNSSTTDSSSSYYDSTDIINSTEISSSPPRRVGLPSYEVSSPPQKRSKTSIVLRCCLIPLELCTYLTVLVMAITTILLAKYAGDEFKTGKHHGHWCWIQNFGWQVAVFYIWAWASWIYLSFILVILSCWVFVLYRCKKKRNIILKLCCYITILVFFWIPASIHRVYVGATHDDHQILGFLQELCMALYGSGNLVIFFAFIVLKLLQKERDNSKRKKKKRNRKSINHHSTIDTDSLQSSSDEKRPIYESRDSDL